MHLVRSARPCPALRSYVRAYQQRELRQTSGALVEPVPARLEPCLHFNLRDAFDVSLFDAGKLRVYPVAVVGLQTRRRSDLIMAGCVEGFAVTFEPTGFSQLFGIGSRDIVDREIDAGSIFGDSIRSILERVGEAGTFQQRVRVVETFLFGRIPQPRMQTRFTRAADHVLRTRGAARITDMARLACLSERQFERGFLAETGCSPKLYKRIARFETALDMKIAYPARSWLEIAHDLGYYDQMHMVHDFQSLIGNSPERFIAELQGARPRAACHPGLDENT